MSSALSGGDVFGKSSTSKNVSQGSQGFSWTPEFLTNLRNVMGATTQWGGPGFTGQGMGAFMQPNAGLFQPSGQEQPFLQQMMGLPGMAPGTEGFNSNFLSPVSAGYGRMFQDVVGPEMKNYLQVQGQGDSGAFGEYGNRFMSSMGPNIWQDAVRSFLTRMPALSAGLGAAAQPRLGQMQNFMNAQNIAGSTMGGVPPFMGSQTFGVNRGFQTNEANMPGQIGGILSILGMLYGGGMGGGGMGMGGGMG